MKTIMHKLRGWMGSTLIFMGIAVAVIGGCLVKAGSWVGDKEVSDLSDSEKEFNKIYKKVVPDLSDKELRQIYKEASEARSKSKKETKDDEL